MRRVVAVVASAIALAAPAQAQERRPIEAAALIADFDAKVARAEHAAAELGAMAARDQLIRHLIIQGFQSEMTAATREAYIEGTRDTFDRIDNENTARLRELFRTISWQDLSTLSPRSAEDAWLIISHSNDIAFKKEMLAILEPLATSHPMHGHRYANLFDDVADMEGRPQRYGTNFHCHDGEFRPSSTEDPERLDERRATLGLETMAVYSARQREMYGSCPSN